MEVAEGSSNRTFDLPFESPVAPKPSPRPLSGLVGGFNLMGRRIPGRALLASHSHCGTPDLSVAASKRGAFRTAFLGRVVGRPALISVQRQSHRLGYGPINR
jgi:hypothetical protein